jgi:signal transduction histidine kinase
VTIRREEICSLLQEIGLPAVRVKQGSAEVIEFNELFSSLVNVAAPGDHRLWFVEGVLARMTEADRTSCEVAFANRTPVQVHITFKSTSGRALNFEMRSFFSVGQKKFDRSVVWVFIPLANEILERVRDAHLSQGRDLERLRMRNELHAGVSQQLLGAAFGCKVLAGKVATLSEELGKEASDLAELVNGAVIELQNLVQSNEKQS